ncbi:eCIS core domain-containing protein [Cellulomonas humilata]|uniref:eCIS core domain-containing protein n=1 Tax=Cellulomonas humilata TaxID=144055 RepID=A0ABU0EBP8_9CELL|nr:DUF4157 domain-containing protein [Cellulomonas humilata]MDQ0372490.1 hypothetical protein [Cellulomonas humilata]
MSAGRDRTTLEKAPERAAAQVAPPVHRDHVTPVAVPGLATGIQRRSVGDDPLGGTTVAPEIGTALRRRQGGGRPLEPEHAERLGAAMGTDLGGVRIHDDGEADTIARSVQATAFTAGSDVYFTRGTYAPGTSGGDHLLAHELAHVVQARSGVSSAQGPVIGTADDPAEAAADSVADSAVRRLQRQTARVTSVAQTESSGPREALAPLRRQAERAGTVRRWNPFKALLGGNKKKTKKLATKTPVPSPVTAKVPTPVEPKVPVPSITTIPKPVTTTVEATVDTAPEVTTPVVDPPTVQDTAPETGAPKDVPTMDVVAPTDATPTTDVVAPTTTTPVVATPEVVTPPTVKKPAKERFEAACDPQTAPANKGVAKNRMDALRVIINGFSGAEKQEISTDPGAMAKGRTHLGDLYYMSLLAAVDTNVKKTDKVDSSKKKHHLTGAEADEFIRTNIEDYPHLKPFVEAAVGAGKKGEGYVASISPEDWAIVYGVEFPTDSKAEQKSTNAYASTKNADGPAILHADRGTPSTAIHESMHRYAPDDVLDNYGFDLNEGITEYFTRVLTDQNAAPAKNGGPERTNYPKQVAFVRDMIYILGGSTADQEKVLAQIYFEGKLNLLETKFKAAHLAKVSTMTEAELGTAWSSFKGYVKKGDWTKAKAKLPAK